MNQQPAENRIPTTDLEPQTGALTPLTIARTRNTSQLDLDRALAEVRTRIAPLWPLEQFVAVNPFLGLTNQPFEQACSTLRRVTGADMLMPRAFYERLIEDGRITETDLRHALRDASGHPGAPKTLAELEDALAEAPSRAEPSTVTVADVLDRVSGSRTSSILVDEIAKWCAAYWDEGQAAWTMPWRYHMTPYAAWRAASRVTFSDTGTSLA